MADSQPADDQQVGRQSVQDNPVNNSTTEPGTDGETKAVEEAKSELHKTMAEVTENPPTEQPPPPSLLVQDLNYEEPMPDPYGKAINYLEKHNILQIFQNMTASIIFQKPENPLEFMISEIGEMKKHRDDKKPASTK